MTELTKLYICNPAFKKSHTIITPILNIKKSAILLFDSK